MKTKIEVDIWAFDDVVLQSLKYSLQLMEETFPMLTHEDDKEEYAKDIEACKRLIEYYDEPMGLSK